MSQKLNQGHDVDEVPADDEHDPVDDLLFLIRVGDINRYVERALQKAAGRPETGEAPHFAAITIDQVRALVNVLKGKEGRPNDWDRDPDALPTDFEMGLFNLEQILAHHDKRADLEQSSEA